MHSVAQSGVDLVSVIKFLLPAIIGGIFSLMTYSISKTQRKIAYNKYNLDLFEKRYEAYSHFRDEFHKVWETGSDLLPLTDNKLEHRPLMKALHKCNLLFPRYHDDGIDGDIYVFKSEWKKKIELVQKEEWKKFVCERAGQALGNKIIENTKEELKLIENELAAIDNRLLELGNKAIGYMDSHLNISQKPY